MQYPIMRGAGKYRVVAAQLSGGLNLSDPPGQVEDNQLTACRNMWWHQGALRTRPGTTLEDAGIDTRKSMPDKVVRINEQEAVLLYITENSDNKLEVIAYSLHTQDGVQPLGHFTTWSWNVTITVAKQNDTNNPYVFFCSNEVDYYCTHVGNKGEMTKKDAYIPTVTVEKFDADVGEYKTVAFEGYNLLTHSYRCTYTSDGERTKFTLPGQHYNRFYKPTVKVTLRKAGEGTLKTFSVELEEQSTGYFNNYITIPAEYTQQDREYYLLVSGDLSGGTISMGLGSAASFEHPVPAVYSNNIEVVMTFPDGYSNPSADRMFDKVHPVWFGGASSGLSDGTRLFMADKSTVRWSEVNKPLYFPENNDATIGNTDDDIVALAKQGDQLIVYKQNEIYAMQYVAGNSVTLEDVENGADISAAAATFPIVPIHPTIGCDCPNSIRLVNNRLVWATSDAHIYMMPSLNLYSERNVRDITALIRRELETYKGSELKAAMAAEYKGHYMLTLPSGKLFLLDTGNSAFQSYTHYASERRASRMLPWYVWDVSVERMLGAVSSSDEVVLLVDKHEGDNTTIQYMMRFDGETDCTTPEQHGQTSFHTQCTPIPCSFSTKVYDFGQVDKLKRVGQMVLSVGSQAGNCVRLTYITERETVEDAYRIEPTETVDLYAPDYLKLYRVLPNVNRTRMFGLRCDSDGTMAVEGIHLTYSLQGDVR